MEKELVFWNIIISFTTFDRQNYKKNIIEKHDNNWNNNSKNKHIFFDRNIFLNQNSIESTVNTDVGLLLIVLMIKKELFTKSCLIFILIIMG